jgi:hypothetical protein
MTMLLDDGVRERCATWTMGGDQVRGIDLVGIVLPRKSGGDR